MASQDLQIFQTADGSPTLIMRRENSRKNFIEDLYEEKMHHSGGAWSETIYIYLPAIKIGAQNDRLEVLSLGLGLGYNEILSAAHALKLAKACHIVSFESSDLLKEQFKLFFQRHTGCELAPAYTEIVQRTADLFELEPQSLIQHVQKILENGSLELRDAFPEALKDNDKFHCILYDAFSNKMNPDLWQEDFLVHTLGKISFEECVFSTYAATGTVKRALRALQFKKIERPGFAGKRDSSFYIRTSKPIPVL